MEDKDMEYKFCVLGEMKYKELHNNIDDSVLFPSAWNLNTNYELKNEILEEAITNNKLIAETIKFQELVKDDEE